MSRHRKQRGRLCIGIALLLLMLSPSVFGLTVTVQEPNGAPVAGFRWLLERDTTNHTVPGAPVADSIGLDIHNSYNPVVVKGHSDTAAADVNVPADVRYFVSVLPDGGYTLGGTGVDVNETDVTVVVHRHPIPTAQISVLAFVDHASVNNVYDAFEQGLGGATVVIAEIGGQQMMDAFGNMLGTTYEKDAFGNYVLDEDGAPIVEMMGDGVITTMTQEDVDDPMKNPYNLKVGEALIKNLAPGKFGIVVIPPTLDDNGDPIEWSLTSTIEGTPTVDAWVKANEPELFVEGFGTGFNHAFFGFVKTSPVTDSPHKGQMLSALPWNAAAPAGTGTITGRLRLNHYGRPPVNQGYFPGDIIGEGWVGLNDPLAQAGLYAAPCNPDGTFVIHNVPAGTYQFVTWDTPLLNLFGIHTVTVGEGEYVDLGDVLEFRWFGTLEGSVFFDNGGGDPTKANNGFRDPGEVGMPGQNLNLRFRDGTVYQVQPTDLDGEYAFDAVFPFFKWLVVEVDFVRFKDTGMTAVVDGGGAVQPHDGWNMPSYDKLNPQVQIDMDPESPTFGMEIVNPNTGNALSRTQVSTAPGEVLLQAMHLFLNQTNVIDWGKNIYGPGENGGISGIVFYDTTRAENDPRFCAGEPWQPGIPRVQVNLYEDKNPIDGVIDDLNEDGGPTLADVDNYPFGWRDDPNLFEEGVDIDRDYAGAGPHIFNAGDAIQIVTTDCWDDNKPTGSIGPALTIHGQQVPLGMDAYATWNQVRPGVFDGGYAIGSYFPGGIDSGSEEVDGLPTGTYIVESTTPPGYELVKEEDKNVDFGDQYVPSPLVLPPIPVGDPRVVPAELVLFPGVPCAFAGQTRPLPDRKQVIVSQGKNAAAEFFFYTEVPKAARGVGFANNDLGAEWNQWSPNFGEKTAPAWIPIALRDWAGVEMHRVYTDEYGCYNFLIPSTFSINVPAPSGVAPQMMTLVLNDPIKPDGTIDEFYNPTYSITPWTFQYYPGSTSYLDTPLVPLSAFAIGEVKLDTEPNFTPVILSLDGPEDGFGPVICSARTEGRIITLQSKGITSIINPAYDPNAPSSPFKIDRDFGFGNVEGQVLLNDVPLEIDGTWTDAEVRAIVPLGATTGRVTVVRGDNGKPADVGVTLHVVDCAVTTIRYVPAEYDTIQEAIDSASAGDLILVAPGTYNENVVMNKPVRLQGSGSGGTIIFGYPNPAEKLIEWHDRINALAPAGVVETQLADAIAANEAPSIIVIGETTLADATVMNAGYPFDTPGVAMIDGFTLSGSKAGGGIYAAMGASNLTISNNHITGNQGNSAGGISIGYANPNFDLANDNVVIRRNKIAKNGGIQGPGGIGISNYSDNYLIEWNLIWGNFSRFNGGGIGHVGLSAGDNVIQFNKVLFNEDHFNALLAGAGDAGGIFVGGDTIGGTGAGNVTINGNLIQGNLTGSGSGGGIRAYAINGADVAAAPDNPDNWYALNLFNNILVNNVAGLAGAGISLQDVAKARIVNNTVANNDSTATSALAFQAGQPNSTPQPAGIVAAPHSGALVALFDPSVVQQYSNPLLVNNIVHHNRSWYNDASLNGGQGGLVLMGGSYWDLAVLGSTTPADPHLNPESCLLGALTDPVTGFNYATPGSGNVGGDPTFVMPYENTLSSATVLDEGGNNINVLIEELTIEGSDYHINTGSAAIAQGDVTVLAEFAELTSDFDGQTRLLYAVDLGADQITAGPVERIVDNLDPGTSSVGIWNPSSTLGFWATNAVFSNVLGNTFTFPATLAPETPYAVYAWWTAASNRSTAVPYEVRDGATLLDTVTVNQRMGGSQWNLLGVYSFSDLARVTVVNAGGITIADAVRFVPLVVESLEITGPLTVDGSSMTDYEATAHYVGGLSAPVQPQVWDVDVAAASIDATGLLTADPVAVDTPAVISAEYTMNGTMVSDTHSITILNTGPIEVIVDNLDPTVSAVGAWNSSSAAGFYATNSVFNATVGNSFTFPAMLVPGTTYTVYGWWTAASNRYQAVPLEIRDGATLLETVLVNQRLNGGQWNLLGTYTFTGGSASVTVVTAGAFTIADAVRFVPVTGPVEVIVDNQSADTAAVGVWTPSASAGFWAVDSLYNATVGNSFTFAPTLVAGTYEVYGWWTAASNRYQAVPFEIRDGATLLDTVPVNQRLTGGQWVLLGTYPFAGGPASVTVVTAGAYTIADAVRFLPVP